MYSIELLHNGEFIRVILNKYNIHIEDSYQVVKRKDMKDFLSIILDASLNRGIFYSRKIRSWIREWKAHNLLYRLGIKKDRTGSVDLDECESKLRRFGYFILSLFSWR